MRSSFVPRAASARTRRAISTHSRLSPGAERISTSVPSAIESGEWSCPGASRSPRRRALRAGARARTLAVLVSGPGARSSRSASRASARSSSASARSSPRGQRGERRGRPRRDGGDEVALRARCERDVDEEHGAERGGLHVLRRARSRSRTCARDRRGPRRRARPRTPRRGARDRGRRARRALRARRSSATVRASARGRPGRSPIGREATELALPASAPMLIVDDARAHRLEGEAADRNEAALRELGPREAHGEDAERRALPAERRARAGRAEAAPSHLGGRVDRGADDRDVCLRPRISRAQPLGRGRETRLRARADEDLGGHRPVPIHAPPRVRYGAGRPESGTGTGTGTGPRRRQNGCKRPYIRLRHGPRRTRVRADVVPFLA